MCPSVGSRYTSDLNGILAIEVVQVRITLIDFVIDVFLLLDDLILANAVR